MVGAGHSPVTRSCHRAQVVLGLAWLAFYYIPRTISWPDSKQHR